MRIALLLSALIWSSIVFSQKKNLQEENGFGPFKLGSAVSEFQGRIRGTLQISYGQDYYLYTGKEISTLYGLKVRKVNLGFFEEKMNYIDYYIKNLDIAAFDALLQLMTEDYGLPDKMDNADENGLEKAYRWKSGNVWLQLKKYGQETIDWDDRNMTVIVCQWKDET